MSFQDIIGVDRKRVYILWISIAIQLTLILLFTLTTVNILYLLIIPIGILALFYLSKPLRFLLFTLFILIVSIPMGIDLYLPFVPLINSPIFLLFIILALFLSYMGMCLSGDLKIGATRKSWANMIVFAFTFSIILAMSTGFLKGNEIRQVILQAFPVSLYIFGFFFAYLFKDENDINKLLYLLLISIAIVGVEYAFLFYISPLESMRVYSYQQVLFVFGLPLCISYMLDRKGHGLALFSIAFLIILIGIILSQTRGLWLASGLILLTTIVMLIAKQPTLTRKIVSIFLPVVGLFVIFFGVCLFFKSKGSGVGEELLRLRLLSILEPVKDLALAHRFISLNYILERIKMSPVFGEGLGSLANYLCFGWHYIVEWTDNSYLMLWWKLGVLGLIIYFSLLFEIFRENLYIFRNSTSELTKVFSRTMLLFIPAFMIWGMSNPLFLKYLYNLIWGILFGITVITYCKIRDEKLH